MTLRTERSRRVTLTVAVFLLLGALVTLAVAWTIACLSPEGEWRNDVKWERGYTHEQKDSWEIDVWRAPGRIVIARCETNWPRYDAQEHAPAPHWSAASRPTTVDDPEHPNRTTKSAEVAYGWPLVAMKYEYDYRHFKVGFSGNLYYLDGVRGGVMLSRHEDFNDTNDWREMIHALPMWIIWSNFALSAAMYGFVLWLLWFVPRSIRRARRRRRDDCPACGYPTGSSPVCTECGERLRQGPAS